MAQTNGITPEVISLIRFSTAEQVAEGKAGIARQRSANVAGARLHGLKIRREMIVIDVSGRHVKDDPQFQELFRELADPTLAGVVASEQSRIFRPEEYGDYAILDHFSKNKKLIYTPSARIDPTTSEGRMTLIMGGLMSGEELHKIRERCNGGKMELRLEGGNPGGNHMLPRTVKYVRVRNEDGKVISAHWELIPLGVERMLLAYRLLFEGDSYHTIAEKLGHGWTGKGIQEAMRNPIHIGIRRYLYEYTGTEYLPEPSVVNPKPKKRRRPVKREVPLDVPTRAELEAGTAKPIVEPIISLEVWDRAQEIMDARMASWRKSKLKNDGRDRHLAASVGKCNCGQPLYGRYGSMKRAHLDRYACKTQWPSGPGCGMKSILRIDLDAAIMETVTRLADAKFLLSVFEAAVAFEQATPDPARAAREQALAKLETGRKEMLGMVRDGEMTRAEFKAEMATLEANVRALEAMAPAPAPTINAKQIVQAVARVFVQFDLLTNSQQRTLLRSAVKSIIVDSHARAITTVTVSGGYLGSGSNLARGLTSTPQIRSIPDVTIHFPEPVVIADTFNGGRFCSESRLNGPARARRPQ